MSKEYNLTNFDFVKSLELDKSYFNNNCSLDRRSLYGQYTDTEKNFLFNFVRRIVRPSKILEFSPCHGYTTCVIASAVMSAEIDIDFFETYELDNTCYLKTKSNISHLGLADDIKVVHGDVLEEMDMDKLSCCDLLFIDSDHSGPFVQKYVDKFFNKLKSGSWIGIHDIDFDENGVHVNGETEVLKKWLEENNIDRYFYLPDLMKNFEVEDVSFNVLGAGNAEYATTLWIQL